MAINVQYTPNVAAVGQAYSAASEAEAQRVLKQQDLQNQLAALGLLERQREFDASQGAAVAARAAENARHYDNLQAQAMRDRRILASQQQDAVLKSALQERQFMNQAALQGATQDAQYERELLQQGAYDDRLAARQGEGRLDAMEQAAKDALSQIDPEMMTPEGQRMYNKVAGAVAKVRSQRYLLRPDAYASSIEQLMPQIEELAGYVKPEPTPEDAKRQFDAQAIPLPGGGYAVPSRSYSLIQPKTDQQVQQDAYEHEIVAGVPRNKLPDRVDAARRRIMDRRKAMLKRVEREETGADGKKKKVVSYEPDVDAINSPITREDIMAEIEMDESILDELGGAPQSPSGAPSGTGLSGPGGQKPQLVGPNPAGEYGLRDPATGEVRVATPEEVAKYSQQ